MLDHDLRPIDPLRIRTRAGSEQWLRWSGYGDPARRRALGRVERGARRVGSPEERGRRAGHDHTQLRAYPSRAPPHTARSGRLSAGGLDQRGSR
jgi:hypothetical protein